MRGVSDLGSVKALIYDGVGVARRSWVRQLTAFWTNFLWLAAALIRAEAAGGKHGDGPDALGVGGHVFLFYIYPVKLA